MIAKKYRLSTKDIRFLLRQKQIVRGKYFYAVTYKQYDNNHYNQFSIAVPKSLSKHAVTRNAMKRVFFSFIEKNKCVVEKQQGRYKKYFFCLHKQTIVDIVKLNLEQKQMIDLFATHMEEDGKKLLLS